MEEGGSDNNKNINQRQPDIDNIDNIDNDMSNFESELDKTNEDTTLCIENVPLTNVLLPHEWILYLYDKQLFKKMAKRPDFRANPNKELCTITTLNDLIYILKLMEVKLDPKQPELNKTNLDANDYIIMRKGIKPLWEDPHNENGGTLSAKVPHAKGYNIWADFVMHMLGETLTHDMHNINGITVSYISDTYNTNTTNTDSKDKCFTLLKIWDGKEGRTREQFLHILPRDICRQIEPYSVIYSPNHDKDHYGRKDMVDRTIYTPRGGYGRNRGFGNYNGGGRGRGGRR
jgi:hypothetical protein